MFCFGQVVPRMLYLRARVKKQPVVCFATRPSVPYITYLPIYFMWTFVLLPISFFSIEDLQVDFFPNVYYRGGTFRGRPVSLLGLRWIWFIQYIHKRAAIQQVGGQAPAVERFKRGHFHHTILPCSLFSIRSIFCLQCFFRRKGCTSRRLFITN